MTDAEAALEVENDDLREEITNLRTRIEELESDLHTERYVLGQEIEDEMGETAALRIERRLWRCGLMEGHASVWLALDSLLDRLEDHALRAQFRDA